MIRPLSLVALTTLFVAGSAAAQSIYTCRDQSGRNVTSDRPIPDCAGVMRELGPSGIVRREIAPPLTADQQRQKEADEKARRAAEEATREKRRRDAALLSAYQSEDQIEAARRRALADGYQSLKTSRARLSDLMKERTALQQEAETYKGKTMPPLFKRKLDDNQTLIDDEEASIKMRTSDVERINGRYDDDLGRFRELKGTAPAPTTR
jgi:hypothetical protein